MNIPSQEEERIQAATKNSKSLVVRYKECQRNHAAALGGNATDGCGEFMPNGEEGTLESLQCSACNCHRNFHRKELEGQHPSENIYHYHPNGIAAAPASESDGGHEVVKKKRFRTKFSKEQKAKMLNFAEKAGWRMRKLEESVVQQFCQEIGIKRRVLKVWMHNNKPNFANRKNNTS